MSEPLAPAVPGAGSVEPFAPTAPTAQAARAAQAAGAITTVRAYHQRSKHHLQRYAAGPDTLDWDAQPDPFRRWLGTPLTRLPLVADALATPWRDLFRPGAITPRPITQASLAALFELSFGLAAWKQQGPDRWAVRCTPSSGNLHPTEAWLLTANVPGLDPGLYHYAPKDHELELRAVFAAPAGPARAFVALSSIHWREAWKYGERAFRYCQLDIGHALGALRYAAALQGWRLHLQPLGTADLAHRLGLDRDADFGPAEHEDAELMVELLSVDAPEASAVAGVPDWTAGATWLGQASRLDRHPMYRWPVINDVACASAVPAPGVWTLADAVAVHEASVRPDLPPPAAANPTHPTRTAGGTQGRAGSDAPAWTDRTGEPAASLIRQRRSAQRFDGRARVPLAQVLPLLEALASDRLPLDGPTARAARVHPLVFVHRVDGLAPGAYLLPRRPRAEALLRKRLSPALDWQEVDLPAPAQGLRLLRLAENTALPGTLRTLNCHQALGSDAVLAFALLAEFDALLGPESADACQPPAAWHYRHLFHEAGLLGQVLYMEAEAAGLAGTGIGCYFDDGLHQLIGLADTSFQSVYHFTVGVRLADPRVTSEAPYARRQPAETRPAAPRPPDPQPPPMKTFNRLTAAELPAWLAQRPNALLLDARDSQRHALGHLDGALRLDGRNHEALLLREDKTRPVLIYCYHGNASQTIAQMFADFGFTEVADLMGGWAAWELGAADRAEAMRAARRQAAESTWNPS